MQKKSKSKTEKTESKNQLIEKNFKKIGLVNLIRKKFRFLIWLLFGPFKNSINRWLTESKLDFLKKI